MKITIKDSISELKRELKMREKVYPKLITSGKLNKHQANRQYLRLKFALEQLEVKQKENTGIQSKLF